MLVAARGFTSEDGGRRIRPALKTPAYGLLLSTLTNIFFLNRRKFYVSRFQQYWVSLEFYTKILIDNKLYMS